MDPSIQKQIEKLYLEMYDKLYVYARSAVDSNALAEEAVQETFRIVCQKPEAVCASPRPEVWLVSTLKNVILNMKRRRDTAKQILGEYIALQMSEGTASEDGVRFELLYENIAELEEFKLLREMVIEGRSHLEMAAKRGITVAACKKRIQRAKETLRKKIGK